MALLQLPVTHDKSRNIETARGYVRRARKSGAELCILPEIWNSPYATSAFPDCAEILPDVGDSIDDFVDIVGDDYHDDDVVDGGGGGGSGMQDDEKVASEDDTNRCRRRRHRRHWGASSIFLMEIAKSTGTYIVGGPVPEVVHRPPPPDEDRGGGSGGGDDDDEDERDGKKWATHYYNTCLILDPNGLVVGKHRKVHLFDV